MGHSSTCTQTNLQNAHGIVILLNNLDCFYLVLLYVYLLLLMIINNILG